LIVKNDYELLAGVLLRLKLACAVDSSSTLTSSSSELEIFWAYCYWVAKFIISTTTTDWKFSVNLIVPSCWFYHLDSEVKVSLGKNREGLLGEMLLLKSAEFNIFDIRASIKFKY
jgi:hypothetical protein